MGDGALSWKAASQGRHLAGAGVGKAQSYGDEKGVGGLAVSGSVECNTVETAGASG